MAFANCVPLDPENPESPYRKLALFLDFRDAERNRNGQGEVVTISGSLSELAPDVFTAEEVRCRETLSCGCRDLAVCPHRTDSRWGLQPA